MNMDNNTPEQEVHVDSSSASEPENGKTLNRSESKPTSENATPTHKNITTDKHGNKLYDGLTAAECTTLMVRNIPNKYSQRMVLNVIEKHGFKGSFDFLYVPSDFSTRVNVGYCFVNFIAPKYAQQFARVFHRLHLQGFKSKKLVQISLGTVQGLKNNIAKFEDSTLCNEFVAPEFHPIIIDTKTGLEIPFRSLIKKLLEPLPPSRVENPEYWEKEDAEKHQPKWDGGTLYPTVILNKPRTNTVEKLDELMAKENSQESGATADTGADNTPTGGATPSKLTKKQKKAVAKKVRDAEEAAAAEKKKKNNVGILNNAGAKGKGKGNKAPMGPPFVGHWQVQHDHMAAFEAQHGFVPPPPPPKFNHGHPHFPISQPDHSGAMSPGAYALHTRRYSARSRSVEPYHDPFGGPHVAPGIHGGHYDPAYHAGIHPDMFGVSGLDRSMAYGDFHRPPPPGIGGSPKADRLNTDFDHMRRRRRSSLPATPPGLLADYYEKLEEQYPATARTSVLVRSILGNPAQPPPPGMRQSSSPAAASRPEPPGVPSPKPPPPSIPVPPKPQ